MLRLIRKTDLDEDVVNLRFELGGENRAHPQLLKLQKIFAMCTLGFVYYEQQINRDLKGIHICGCRFNERLNAKTDGSMYLT